jgi:glycosyltransferase involved in cell wall biosynthesis
MPRGVSIVIPAYNSERFLAETIESVIAQSYVDWELIIIDDGSQDSTPSIIAEYTARDSRIRRFRQDNRGLSAARNRGIAASDHELPYIIFLDSDDVWEPHALDTLVGALERDPDAVASYGLARYIDQSTQPIFPGVCESRCRIRATFVDDRVVSIGAAQPSTFETFIVAGCIATPGVCLMRRAALTRAGEFDTSLRQCEDWDMYIRLSRTGHFHFIDDVVLGYRVHSANMTRNRRVQKRMERIVLRKAMSAPENDAHHREVARRSYRSGQRFFFRAKVDYLKSSLQEHDYRRAAREACYALGHAARYVRGRP